MNSKQTLQLAKQYKTLGKLLEQENNMLAKYDGHYCDSYAMELERELESVYLDLIDSIENDKIKAVLDKIR